VEPSRQTSPFAAFLRRFFSIERNILFALVTFLSLFAALSTAAITFLPWGHVTEQAAETASLAWVSEDLHATVSETLTRSGLHAEEIIGEESYPRHGSRGSWREYRREILVLPSFPIKTWLLELESSLGRAGAVMTVRDGEGKMIVEVCRPLDGKKGEILVETVVVNTRPSPDAPIPHVPERRPRIALVIDDLGQNPAHYRRLAALGLPFTASILPDLPYSRWTGREAAKGGVEVLLHLPMEPLDYPQIHPGPGSLLVEMSDKEMRDQLSRSLSAVPWAKGVNNHMGSRLTGDRQAMEILMLELKSRGLFFLDSKTSSRSLAFETAYRFDLPASRRDIFLDAENSREFVQKQVRNLLAMARRRGSAIAIGHPYDNTLSVLEEMRDQLMESGIDWVPVSKLVTQGYRPGEEKISSLPGSGSVD
jgi:polysaccharide deacetylase 2 family uncharacterized protein YibQ